MRLVDAIKEGKFKLTDKEKHALQAIKNQGSFFSEGGGNESVREVGNCFLGYQLTKEDVYNKYNPSGVIGSLIKKGILIGGDPFGDGESYGYWITYELDFTDDFKIMFE